MESSFVHTIPMVENGAARSLEAIALWEPGSSPILRIENGPVGRLVNTANPADSQGVFTMAVSYKADKIFFVGVADPESFALTYNSFLKSLDFLCEAVNNRTRERNYFKKYAECMMGEISEDEFNREIEEHEDQYVVQPHIEASKEDMRIAVELVEKGELMDVDSLDDIADLFSFKYQSMRKLINALRG